MFGSDAAKYAADVDDIIRSSTPGRVAGFISETIQVSNSPVPVLTRATCPLLASHRCCLTVTQDLAAAHSPVTATHSAVCLCGALLVLQGVGGAVPVLPGYLPRVYEAVRAAGGVCIADEVQTGFGRTGEHYWGFQAHGIVPDIVTMAKVTRAVFWAQQNRCSWMSVLVRGSDSEAQ